MSDTEPHRDAEPKASAKSIPTGRREVVKAGVVATGAIAAVYVTPTLNRLGIPIAQAMSGGGSSQLPLLLTIAPSTISIRKPPSAIVVSGSGFPVGQCAALSVDRLVIAPDLPITVASFSFTIPILACFAGWRGTSGLTLGPHAVTLTIVDCSTRTPTGASVSASVTLTS